MKKLTAYYLNKDILFKDIKSINPKEIKSRKKLDIFISTSIAKEYYSIFIINAKSRFLKKNADDLMMLCEKLKIYADHNFRHKELLISSPLCSKAKKYLQDNKWKIRIDFM